MTTLIILAVAIVVVVVGVAARPALKRLEEKNRLRLAAAKEEREAEAARARERAAEIEALIAAQPAYFAGCGITVTERMSTPRAAETGLLHLTKVSVPGSSWKERCPEGCDAGMLTMREVAPGRENSEIRGVIWDDIGRYCPRCGAWKTNDEYLQHFKPQGPLGRRLRGATNLFDILGDPKASSPEDEWRKLDGEEAELEARLNRVRTRRLALAEKLGKPIGSPFRPQLVAGGKES